MMCPCMTVLIANIFEEISVKENTISHKLHVIIKYFFKIEQWHMLSMANWSTCVGGKFDCRTIPYYLYYYTLSHFENGRDVTAY